MIRMPVSVSQPVKEMRHTKMSWGMILDGFDSVKEDVGLVSNERRYEPDTV